MTPPETPTPIHGATPQVILLHMHIAQMHIAQMHDVHFRSEQNEIDNIDSYHPCGPVNEQNQPVG